MGWLSAEGLGSSILEKSNASISGGFRVSGHQLEVGLGNETTMRSVRMFWLFLKMTLQEKEISVKC